MKYQDLVKKFKDTPFIELKEILASTKDSANQIKNQLYQWAKQGKLERLCRGNYLLSESYRKHAPSVYYISNYLYRPSYVSLHTALQFYGLIPEAVNNIQAVTPKHGQERDTSFGVFKYYSIKQERFWGYKEIILSKENKQNKFLMALPEKALLDFFYFQKGSWPVARIREMRFQGLDSINIEIMRKFAIKYESPKILQAAGNFIKYIQENNK